MGAIVESSRGAQVGHREITNHFLLEAKDGALGVTGTDTVTFVRMHTTVDLKTPGVIAVQARTLERAVRALPDGNVAFRLEDEQLVVSAGRGRYVLPILPGGDYPSFPEPTAHQDAEFKLPISTLHRLLHTTALCASDNESRYYLNGIYLHVNGDRLLAVATDGMRLARCHVEAPKGASTMKGVIVPRRAIAQIETLLGEQLKQSRDGTGGTDEADGAKEGDASTSRQSPKSLTLSTSETMAWFTLDKTQIATKLVDGAFPDYERVIPRENNRVLSMPIGPLKEAITRAMVVVSSDGVSAVRFDVEKGALNLSSGEASVGRFEDNLEIAYDGDPIAIGFNGALFAELLPPLQESLGESGQAELHLLDESSPMLFHSADDDSLVYVLMPLRI
ncbi:MAG: DNA polymerase III subunit beta [Alphaproteobacteria bacterium]